MSDAEPPRWYPLEHVLIAGQWVAVASRGKLVEAALHDCRQARRRGRVPPRLIFDANGQGVSLARTNPGFRASLDQADVTHADGSFVVQASKLFSPEPIPERTATTDMIHDFAAAAAREGLSFYLLGGTEDANSRCADILRQRYPGLIIAGRRNGYFPAAEEDAVIGDINRAAPDFLWVGLGKPIEQAFSCRVRDRLDAVWLITCGGCFNFVTGDYSRAPAWMQAASIEWVHRMATQPRKLFWRYLTTTPHAFLLALTGSKRRMRVQGYPPGCRSET